MRQVYLENSHSAFRVETTVVGWIDLPETEAYYTNRRHDLSASRFDEAVVEALDVLDADPERRPEHADFDFGAFDLDENGALDGFGVLHSGAVSRVQHAALGIRRGVRRDRLRGGRGVGPHLEPQGRVRLDVARRGRVGR